MQTGFGGRHVWNVGRDAVSLVRPVVPPRPFAFDAFPHPVIVDLAHTALTALEHAKLPMFITHAAGMMLVSDQPNSDLQSGT